MLDTYRGLVGLGRNGSMIGPGGGSTSKVTATRSGSRAAGWTHRRVPRSLSGLELVAAPPPPMTLSRLPFASAPRRPAGSPPTRVAVYVRRPPHVEVSIGQACDPATASCPEFTPEAVRMDLPAEWLSTFLPPTGEQLSEAAADASSWERFVTEYTTRAGMAYARLRANLVNYRNFAAGQTEALTQMASQHGAALSSFGRAKLSAAISQSLAAMQYAIREQVQLDAVAAGRSYLAFNVPEWRFAYIRAEDMPADAPAPIVVDPINASGLGDATVIVIVAVVGLFVAGGAIAWWAAAAEKAKPAEIDAEARRKLTDAQAASLDASTELARQAADRGDVATAQAILATSRERFGQDIQSLTLPEWARTAATQAEAGEGIGSMIKWALLALFALKAMETLK